MSIIFSDADIDFMRAAQGLHAYTDKVIYIAAPTGTDAYGQPNVAGVETSIDCAFVDGGKNETWTTADVEVIDAEVYFASITPTKGGRIKIIKRFGQDVINKTFEIIGIQERGAFGFVCALKAATI